MKLEDIPVLYINLNKRKDRRKQIESELQGFRNIERVEAIDTCTTSGYFGCVLSHIKAINIAKEKGYNEVLICEDDFEFVNRDKFVYPDIDFDVCMISGKINEKEFINWNYNKVIDGRHTDCYIIRNHYYDTLINNFTESYEKLKEEDTHKYYLDVYWLNLQKKDNFITPTLLIGRQREGYSDIQKAIMKRYKDE